MSNEFDAAVTASLQPDTAQAARVGFSVAADTNPDAYAEAQRVARRTGVPVDTVFAMPAEMKKQDAIGSIDFNDLAKTSPATAALLADVEKAKVAHDDVDNMSKIESALYSIGKFEAGTGKAIASSVMKFNEGAWGLARAGADLLPDVIGDPLANKFAEYGASQRSIAARLMPKTDNIVESSWYSGMQSLGLNLLQLPLGIGGKMTPLLTAMGLNTGGQAYGEARDKGRSVPESLAFGTSQGIVEAGTEIIGMPALLSMFKPGGFGKKALEYLVKEQGGEQIATHLQDLNEWATLNPDKTIGDYLAARPSAALQTALATAFGGGGQVAIMRGAQLLATRGEDALQANHLGDLLTDLNKLAEASKLRERDTESAQAFFQSVLDEGRDAVYVSPEALAQSGLAEKMAQAIPAVAEQLQTAADAGHDIRIPIADLMATMAGPELEQSLLPHVATEPGGFTPTTAKEYLQSGAAQDLQTEVERVLGDKQTGDAFKQSAEAVKATIKDQLTTAGRFTESVNDAYSSMVSNFYAVQAARTGTTPEEMFAKYPLRIGAESVAGGHEFAQNSGMADKDTVAGTKAPTSAGDGSTGSAIDVDGVTRPALDSRGNRIASTESALRDFWKWFGDSKFVDSSGRPIVVFHGTTAKFTEFDRSERGTNTNASGAERGFFFAGDSSDSNLYVEIAQEKARKNYDEEPEGRILKAYLKADNPLILTPFEEANIDDDTVNELIDSDPVALDYAVDNGFDAVIWPHGNMNNSAYTAVVFLPDQIRFTNQNDPTTSAGSDVLNQQARGSFNPATMQITLLKNADLSTFLHESGHFFLEVQADLAAQPDAPEQVRRDMQATLDWFGVEDLAEWNALDFEEKRSYHEQFARGFESYLFEGKAPSIEMQGLFQRFRAWMLNVYRDLKALNVELTDEVRGVFDRMLATNEQITLAEQGRSMMPLFTSPEQIGMTPAEFADYQALGTDATNEAVEDLQARGMRDMQWLHNARGRIIKKLQAQSKEQRAAVEMDVRREVMAKPIYQAWQFLTGKAGQKTGTQIEHDQAIAEWKSERADYEQKTRDDLKAKLLDANPDTKGIKRGQLLAKNKRQMDIDTQQAMLEWDRANQKPEAPAAPAEGETAGGFEFGRLNISALSEIGLPAEVIQTLKAHRMTSKDGFHPDIVAEMFGFSSGDELARKLAAAESPKAEIEALTDQRMLEQFGDLSSQQAIEKAADKAIHNEARARMISTELAMLEKAVGKRTTLASAAKEYAAAMIARLKVRDIKPGQYASGEVRASKASENASKSGDLATAAAEKRNQIINHYATRAAYDAQEEVERGRRYFGRFDKPGSIDQEYAEQIHALLERYDLRKSVSGNSIDRQASLRTWVQSQLNAGELPLIAESLLNPAERSAYVAQIESRGVDGELVYSDDEERIKLLADAIDRSEKRSYKMLTVEEFRGLVDTVKQIEHLGRLKHKLMTARDNADYEAVRDDIAAGIADEASATGKNTRTANDWLGQKLQAIRQFGAAHIKVATWARIMDGGKDNGPVWRYLIQPANERASQETTMRADATAKLDAILRPIMSKVSMADKMGKGKFFTGINDSLNWQERFAVLLNLGNESNTQRLMAGKGWTMAQIMPIINTFSDEELRAAQAVWDHFEEYRPLIASKELRVTGKEPEWIPARQITLNANDGQVVTLRGGYYPVVYDPRVNLKASQHSSAEEAKNLLKASYSAATTRRSFTKARVEEVHGRPILLNMQGLYSGVNDVIHDLAWHEWVMDANKLLRSKTIDTAIRNHYGPEVKREFEKWRDDIVAGNRRLDHAIEKAAGWARQSVSGSSLTFNIVSAAMQPLGIANSISRVGAHWIGKGIARYASGPLEATREAQEKSEWMANRTRTRFRELNELRNQVQGQTAVKELMGRYGYWMMMRAQMMVDVPTWWGAYEKGIADGHDETTAINLADQSVKDSQGGGEEVDQSGVERGGPLVKLFTAFYGFMGTTLNTAYLNGKTEKSKAKMAVNMLLVLSVPSVLGSLFKDALVPGDAGDDDSFLKKLLIEQLSFLFGLVAFGREFTPIIKAVSGESNGQSYSGPTGLRVIPDTINLGKQAGQGEFDDAFRKAFINVVGDLTGIPSVQINRTITGAKALVEGETSNPAAIAFGFQKPR